MRRSKAPASLLAAVLVFGCSDQGERVDPAGPGAPAFQVVEGEIRAAIDALFGTGHRSAAHARFNTIERHWEKGREAEAREQVHELVDWTLKRYTQDQLSEPSGTTLEAAIAGFATLLYAYVEESPDPIAVPLASEEDGVVAVVSESGGTVTTPSEEAGVSVPDGAADETLVITIYREEPSCLPTALAQVEGCYTFAKSSAEPFSQPVEVGVCIDPAVTAEEREALLLYRYDPADPSAGVMPTEPAPAAFLDCSGFATAAAGSNALVRYAHAGWRALRALVAPSPLYAGDTGAGGLTVNFSLLGWAEQPELAWTSNGSGNADVYVTDGSGHAPVNLTANHTGQDDNPKWSPDGSTLLFTSNRAGNLEIFTMDAAGGNVTQLTFWYEYDRGHSWSPDGSQIAFSRIDPAYPGVGGSGFGVWIMDADGSNASIRATDSGSPDFSPDGRFLAMEQADFLYPPIGHLDVFVLDLLNPAILTNVSMDTTQAFRPAWSPDGSRIAFTTQRDGNTEIYVMNADGTNQVRLTNNAASDGDPAWSPDGGLIAFHSDRSGNYDIWIIRADGTGLTQFTDDPGHDRNPNWRPPTP